MEKQQEASSGSGVTYVVAPDGTVHFVTSLKDVAELALAYRDYLR